MTTVKRRAKRVLYLTGAGDAGRSLKAFAGDHWNPEIGHIGYSDQLMRACDDLGLDLLMLCSNPKTTSEQVRGIALKHYNDPLLGRSHLAYQWAHLASAQQILREARKFDADTVVVPTEPYPFLLEPLRLLGINVIQSLHCVLWPDLRPRPRSFSAAAPLLGHAYRKTLTAVLSASHYITRQVESLGGPDSCPIIEFFPTFRAEAYQGVPPPPDQRPFRVMFVGRFEEDKGVLTLLEVARQLRKLGRTDIVFDLCGDGSAFKTVEAKVREEGLGDIFVLHGWCNADRLKALSGGAHLFVVPTTTAFIEGFNHAIIEGLLVGRPVITSRVCPAVDYVGPCVSLVEPDVAEGYLRGIIHLADHREAYLRLQRACLPSAARFLSPENGFGEAVRDVLRALQEGRSPQRRLIQAEPRTALVA